MSKTSIKKANPTASDPAVQKVVPSKHQQMIDMLSRDSGATLEDMSNTANWLTHSTRAFLSGLKKQGYDVVSDKVEGVRRYKITNEPVA